MPRRACCPCRAHDDRLRRQFAAVPRRAEGTRIDAATFRRCASSQGARAVADRAPARRRASGSGAGVRRWRCSRMHRPLRMSLPAGTGAAAVRRGAGDDDRLRAVAWRTHAAAPGSGLASASAGSCPDASRISAPPLQGTLLMLGAGIAWGIYSLRGRAVAIAARDWKFLRAVPFGRPEHRGANGYPGLRRVAHRVSADLGRRLRDLFGAAGIEDLRRNGATQRAGHRCSRRHPRFSTSK